MKTATDEGYASTIREAMKKSMEQPAEPIYRSLNKREPRTVPAWTLGAVMAGLLVAGVLVVYGFNYVESLFR